MNEWRKLVTRAAVEQVESEARESNLTLSFQWTPSYGHKPYISRVIGLQLRRWKYLSSFKFSQLSSGRCMCFETECIMTLQGHPRSLILALIRRIFQHHTVSTPLFGRKFPGVPLGVDRWCLGCKERTSQANWWWNYFRRIPTWSQSTNVTDRHDDMRSQERTLHYASRGKNCVIQT